MNTDCKPTRPFSAIKQTLTPFIGTSGKTLTLSLALILGACASTADKPVDEQSAKAQAAETRTPAKTSQPASAEPAPSATELMKTLRAPLKEPEPAKPVNTVGAEPGMKKEAVVKADQPTADEKMPEKSAEAPAVMAEPAMQTTPKDAQKKAANLTPQPSKPVVSEPAAVVKKAEAVVEQSASVVSSDVPAGSGAKPFSVTAKQLPFSYDIWTIRKGNTPLTQGLVIVTPTWEMGKEGYMSQIWLTLMEDKIHINSSSDIETAIKGLGIRIDGGDLIPFTTVAETNIGVIEGKWLDRLAKAGKIDIYLGFFPGKKPMSDTFKSDLSLSNLDRVVATYRLLNK